MTAKRPLEPADLYRLRLISDAAIAPDGTRVAFVLKQMDEEKDEYRSNIYVADREGNVHQLTSGDKDSSPRWSPDGATLAFLSARKEKPQIYLLPMSGGEASPLTERPLGAGVPEWSPDGKFIAFTGPVSTDPDEEKELEENGAKKNDDKKPAKTKISARTRYKSDGAGYIGNRRRHIFVVEVESKALTQLTEGDFHNDGASWSPDGAHIAFNSNRDPNWDVSPESHIYVVAREGGEARRLTSESIYFLPRFSPDGSRIAFVGSENPQESFLPSKIFSIARDGSDLRCESGDWDGDPSYGLVSDIAGADNATQVEWRENGISFLGSARGESDVYLASDGAVQNLTEGRHAITSFSIANDGTLAYSMATSTQPMEIFICKDGREQQLTHENDAFLEEVLIQQPERISYPGANGEDGEGWLLRPRGGESGKHPLIVYIHGGPMLAHGEAFFFEYQYLVGQGFGVFFPNIHGGATYGRDYQASITGNWGSLDYTDVLNGAEEAKGRDWVDDSRVGIIGGSYGGFMTSWTMGHTDRFKAGVTERCLCNWVSFMGTSDGGVAWKVVTGAYPEDDVQKLWDMSPVKYAPNVQGPLMVIHYEGDLRTPLEQGEQMFNALRRNEKDTKFVVYPEESHGMTRGGKPSRRVERMGIIRDWFSEKL